MTQIYEPSSSAIIVEKDAQVQSLALREMLAELDALEQNTEIYDEDCIKPSPYAFSRTRYLLAKIQEQRIFNFPAGTVYPDGSGALRVEWMRAGREVTLVVYSNEEDRHYIFHKEGKIYGGDYEITAQRLAFYLERLSSDE